MKSSEDLRARLRAIDHRGYPAYKDLKGQYDFGDYVLSIDHVQGDPFAAPSRLSVHVNGRRAGFPAEYYDSREKRITLQDHLTRLFGAQLARGGWRPDTSFCASRRAFLPEDGPSTPGSWKRCSSTSCPAAC